LRFDSSQKFYYVVFSLMVALMWALGNLRDSRIGRAFITIREDRIGRWDIVQLDRAQRRESGRRPAGARRRVPSDQRVSPAYSRRSEVAPSSTTAAGRGRWFAQLAGCPCTGPFDGPRAPGLPSSRQENPMRTIRYAAAVVLFVFLATSVEALELRHAEAVHSQHIKAKYLEQFQDLVKQKTGGAIEIKTYYSDTLYSIDAGLKALSTGELDLMSPP